VCVLPCRFSPLARKVTLILRKQIGLNGSYGIWQSHLTWTTGRIRSGVYPKCAQRNLYSPDRRFSTVRSLRHFGNFNVICRDNSERKVVCAHGSSNPLNPCRNTCDILSRRTRRCPAIRSACLQPEARASTCAASDQPISGGRKKPGSVRVCAQKLDVSACQLLGSGETLGGAR
jgi:hypothetical protein